jgi:hypothetical protein
LADFDGNTLSHFPASFVVRVDRCRLLTARGDFHAGFDAQVLGDARHNDP